MTLSLNNFCRAFPSLQNNSTSTSFSSSASSFSDSRGGFIVRASLGTKKKKKNHLVAHFHREKTHRQQSHHHRRRRRGVGVAAEQQENNNEKNFQTGERLDEKVSLFGITHTQKEYEAAEYIMKSKPKFVVCETAVSAGHGEQHGNMVTFEQGVQQMMIDPTLDEALTFVTRLAGEMKSEVDKDALVGDFWMSMREQLPAEPLVYAAAMYVDAKIVFADRPKRSTYGRLVTEPTLEELDEAFSKQSERNYRLLLPESDKLRQECDSIITENDAFQKYIIDERDQIMTSCIRKCVSSEDGQSANSVVVVVGADHFEGIKKCYKDVFGASEVEAKVPELLECKDVSSVDSPGLRLAIALRMLGLRCSPDLIDDIMRSLEKDVAGLDNAEKEKFELNSEAFGSTRMLLALVDDREVFDATVAGLGKSDFWEKLAKFRNMRPKYGGSGMDEANINELRLASMVGF
ncbi:predicted protein [Bathycoccus prasinos]|uniref:TraB family protein n=1 Tax=Bathycoccus prasinos TaxID=41875 RepID=K8EAV2_9CHLO|nr:predicted protein [Bathycoccus prasinos]CCO14879.1 predicted protein [Bathycoccus prasinos]|eukprot:XP_007514639.1 predicted protein [Bathycoccus prasinos]